MDNELLIMPNGDGGTPPDMPDGESGGGTPPDGNGGNSSSSSSVSWSGATEITSGGTYENQTYTSTSSNQNSVLINTSDAVVLTNPTVTKSGGDSAGDEQSFYGTNSAVMVKGGTSTTINGGTVTTYAAGANGIFSYGGNGGQNGADGDGTTVNISNVQITTTGDGSGGIMTTGGGNTIAENLTINTSGQSSAAIRTDRGGGNVTVTGGSYTSNGVGSPAIYSTADIIVNDATLTSNKSEGVCIEGLNSVTLNNCTLTANNTQTNGNATFLDGVMIYQSMSGDSAEGTSTFTMNGGTLINNSGHVFHVTNTSAIINLNGVNIQNNSDNILLSVSDDGWSGASNVATLNASGQTLTGKILVGSDSTLTINLSNGATSSAIISGDITNSSGDTISTSLGTVNLTLDDTSKFYLSGDTYVTSFSGDAANVITRGYNFYVNGNILDGTSTSEETLPSGLSLSSDGTLVSADSTFSGTINLQNYPDVKIFDASNDGNNIIVIGNNQDNSIIGGSGSDSLYGAGGNNILTGGAGRDQFWFTENGSAVVTDFVAGTGDDSDVITFTNVILGENISRAGSHLNFASRDTGVTMDVQTNSDDGNGVFFYSLDGNNIYGAKIGNDSQESLTYDSSANYYRLPGEGGTLYVNDGDDVSILLDNSSESQYFFGIQNVIANNSGDNTFTGNNKANLFVGGSGTNNMWGGLDNAADTLQGGDGTNVFWYGGHGNDVITNAKESDVVNLYNISLRLISDVQITEGNILMTFVDNESVLTIKDTGNVTPTFQLADSVDRYNYNRSSGTWQSVE